MMEVGGWERKEGGFKPRGLFCGPVICYSIIGSGSESLIIRRHCYY